MLIEIQKSKTTLEILQIWQCLQIWSTYSNKRSLLLNGCLRFYKNFQTNDFRIFIWICKIYNKQNKNKWFINKSMTKTTVLHACWVMPITVDRRLLFMCWKLEASPNTYMKWIVRLPSKHHASCQILVMQNLRIGKKSSIITKPEK